MRGGGDGQLDGRMKHGRVVAKGGAQLPTWVDVADALAFARAFSVACLPRRGVGVPQCPHLDRGVHCCYCCCCYCAVAAAGECKGEVDGGGGGGGGGVVRQHRGRPHETGKVSVAGVPHFLARAPCQTCEEAQEVYHAADGVPCVRKQGVPVSVHHCDDDGWGV